MSETDEPAQEQLDIPRGLSAMFLPELSDRDEYGGVEPAKPEDVLARANSFLSQLNAAGADIKAIIPIEINAGKQSGTMGDVTEVRQLIIVKK